MPFDVQMPDGTTIADVPDGTTKAQIAAKYQAHLSANSPSKDVPAPEGAKPADYSKAHDITPNGVPGFLSDLGHSAAFGARSLLQGALSLPATIADVPALAYDASADLIQGKGKGFRFPEQNQALSDVLTKMGAPVARGGLERIVGAAEQGIGGAGSTTALARGLTSAASPVVANSARVMAQSPGKAMVSGGLGGGASGGAREAGLPWYAQMAAGLGAGTLPYLSPSALASGGAISPNEQQAMAAGYKLNPATMENPSLLSKVLGGWSGKIKTQQAASAANQETTNGIAATELGLPHDTTLDDNAFSSVRGTAGKAYEAVKRAVPTITPDESFRADVQKLGALNSDLARDFPELVKNDEISSLAESLAKKGTVSTAAAVDAVKSYRAKGTKNLQAIGDPQKNDLGFAQRQAANAIDDLIERNLTSQGDKPLADAYRFARQRIAKSHDVEAATNTATGDVSAAKLAQIGNKRPLSGGLDTISQMGNAFPKVTQSPSKFGGVEPLSVLDLLGAIGTGGAATLAHRPLEGAAMAATVLSRPAARAGIMSNAYQRAIANPTSFSRSAVSLPVAQLQPLIRALSEKGNNQ